MPSQGGGVKGLAQLMRNQNSSPQNVSVTNWPIDKQLKFLYRILLLVFHCFNLKELKIFEYHLIFWTDALMKIGVKNDNRVFMSLNYWSDSRSLVI